MNEQKMATLKRSFEFDFCGFQDGTNTAKRISRSVTRIGEISPLWQNFGRLFLIWQIAEPSLSNS